MKCIPLKTNLIKANDDLIEIIKKALQKKKERLKNSDILIIASKAVAYSQGRVLPIANKEKLEQLVDQESEKSFGSGKMKITIANKILIANAGIDNSNAPEGMVILWPAHPFKTARQIQQTLKDEFHLKQLGVVITDSTCRPLRQGTTGIALAWAGFEGIVDERGKRDLFNQRMKYTTHAVADDIASAANLLMGETNASTPMVLMREVPVKWNNKKASEADYWMPPEECIYRDVLSENF